MVFLARMARSNIKVQAQAEDYYMQHRVVKTKEASMEI
jgi:hypothetical protein